MKKQFLIQLIMAMFAVVITNTAIGQAIHHENPVALTCTSGPLNPIAGNPYNYGVTATPAGGNFQWWATTDQDFIAAGTNNIGTKLTTASGALLGTSASYGVTSVVNNVDITWSSATLSAAVATPTFVVAQYDATCANNLKVYKITPVNGFTVDIQNLDATKNPLGYGTSFSTCVSPVQSAKYVAGAIVTDYGTNVLYYEVVAANFTGSWVPTFTLPALPAGMTATVVWDYDGTFAGATHAANNGDPVLTSVTNTSNGVSIYVRVTIQNGTHEGLADVAYPLYVNGTDAASLPDVPNTDCTLAPSALDDLATQTLLARPTVTAAPATGTFVTP
jgi:hypothetical protein